MFRTIALRQPCLERQMQSHLNNPALISGLKSGHPAKQRTAKQRIGIGPVAVVKNIQSLGPELEVGAFMKTEGFQQGRIYLRRAWPSAKRAWRVAESVSRVLLEGGSIEPFPVLRTGSPTRFGRTPSENEPVLLTASSGLSGVPVCNSAMVPNDQPPITSSRMAYPGANLLPCPKGSSYTPLTIRRWRMSLPERPQRDFGL
jgi:hypothetical protein